MNCTASVAERFRAHPDRAAFWTVSGHTCSFGEVERLAAGTQALARSRGIGPGDPVLLLGLPGPRLFAAVLGLLGLGAPVVFVEPWLPVRELDDVIRRVRPRAFVGSRLARLWALRVGAVRSIPDWQALGRIEPARGGAFVCADLDPDAPGTVTFSSGTTGAPKGLVRSHRCLATLFRLMSAYDEEEAEAGPDLCVFPNLALLHLATGRGSVLFPTRWGRGAFRRVAAVARAAEPTTVSCGPGFLERLVTHVRQRPGDFSTLRRVAVGGAQIDCGLLEEAFTHWPAARWLQVYGGSEAEPVAVTDARESVERSRARDRFQALFLGRPIPEIDTSLEDDGLWVSGPNVATRFGDGPPSDGRRVGEDGREWHCLGDRIEAEGGDWWYGGRARQPREEFELEQRLYGDLGTSACFVHRSRDGRLMLFGEGLPREARRFAPDFRTRHPELDGVRPLRIVRDRRHRARIDRGASLARAGLGEA
ncbi:MAG TPA: AMP-binding protein [Longimicrobiales bacterium]|nr:AMP-binding protein [Longimicrobiales bacterium]